METLQTFGNWGVRKSLHFFQSLNSDTQKAREKLQTTGVEALSRYKAGDDIPNGAEIQDLVIQVLAPIQTLYILSGACTVGFYVGRQIAPWPISWLSTSGMCLSGFTFCDVSQLKKEVQVSRFYFERRDVEEISQEEFVREMDHLGDRMLASSDILRVIHESSGSNAVRFGDLVTDMIKKSGDQAALKELVKGVAGLTALFKINNQIGM